ncbi:MAG: hypothetical protein WBA09_22330 [Candidatus Acidiferrum sp.]
MAITVTPTYYGRIKNLDGSFPRRALLAVSGLTAGAANSIPHGLPGVPQTVDLNPSALGLWGETSIADATNIYVTVGTGGATSGWINVAY